MQVWLTCGVLPLLLQIPQHCTHTPLVPIILHFRVIAAEREATHTHKLQMHSFQWLDESNQLPITALCPMCVRRWSKSPDIVAALFVQAVIGEVHEQVLNVLWSPVVLDCGKPADGQSLFSQDKKKHCTCHSADISAVTTTFKDLTLEWTIEALGGEINIWQRLRGVDATCAIIRIPGHTLRTWIPTQAAEKR